MNGLEDIARLPEPGDNAAIAIRNLEPGTRFVHGGAEHALRHGVLEGHRFAVESIAAGEPVLSWGQPFGHALRDIEAGDYLCNAAMLDALGIRQLPFALPEDANLGDADLNFEFDEQAFRPGSSPAPHSSPATFSGYARSGGRGSGTRNFIILLGASSLAASFARALEQRLKGAADAFDNIDGIVSVTHTEGGEAGAGNNREFVLRTLAGFVVHPNVGAALVIDQGDDSINNRELERYMRSRKFSLDHVPHRFYSIGTELDSSLEECARQVEAWLEPVNRATRSDCPLAGLRVALQCGGSDAFSGISGNPLAARVALGIIRHGGAAVLAETDELIGAEDYILSNTRDLQAARSFLEKIRAFEERAAWHGQSVRDNPTGGNKYRGLYNIILKSVGAARKKDPGACLDYVIDYGEQMAAPGYYFMDSPGNDLESTAGQVAAGSNIIFFITGNGAITNFPFVPTVKIITTTGRWELMPGDMDVNAGRYLDGEPLEALSEETFDLAVNIASGQLSAGEKAGHSQTSIWRDWRQTRKLRPSPDRDTVTADGQPIEIAVDPTRALGLPPGLKAGGQAAGRVGLIVPTSLCSGQIARRIAAHLNDSGDGGGRGPDRYVALVHTEGCGTSSGENEEIYLRTMTSYLLHPCVDEALLLEHGCEHTHNDMFRDAMRRRNIDPNRFGYASIQLDGGIERVTGKVEDWFSARAGAEKSPGGNRDEVASIALATDTEPSSRLAESLGDLAAAIVHGGGSVVIPQGDRLLGMPAFCRRLGIAAGRQATVAHGATPARAGLHIMEAPSAHLVENLTGLGAAGVSLILVFSGGRAVQSHPLIPTLQFTEAVAGDTGDCPDLDYVAREDDKGEGTALALLDLMAKIVTGEYSPRIWAAGYTDFQITRGLMGVSL